MVPWKTTFLWEQRVFHFHVSESDCILDGRAHLDPSAARNHAPNQVHRSADDQLGHVMSGKLKALVQTHV